MNEELVSLWNDIGEALRYQEKSEDVSTPSQFPPRILGLEILSSGSYPIYVTAPPGSTITATSMGGGVSTQAYLMRMVTG